jgi:hypothetical protein
VRVQQRRSGRLRIVPDQNGRAREQEFDFVVLALPWMLLRQVELEVLLPAANIYARSGDSAAPKAVPNAAGSGDELYVR